MAETTDRRSRIATLAQAALADETPEAGLTPQQSLDAMQQAANAFYQAARQVECHAFIEFAGLMNEFITICSQSENRGIDWRHANTHSGEQLEIASYQVGYINEKLECIFQGLSFASQTEGGQQSVAE